MSDEELKSVNTNPNLTDCPACGHLVSKSAVSCPQCGHPLQPIDNPNVSTTPTKEESSGSKNESITEAVTAPAPVQTAAETVSEKVSCPHCGNMVPIAADICSSCMHKTKKGMYIDKLERHRKNATRVNVTFLVIILLFLGVIIFVNYKLNSIQEQIDDYGIVSISTRGINAWIDEADPVRNEVRYVRDLYKDYTFYTGLTENKAFQIASLVDAILVGLSPVFIIINFAYRGSIKSKIKAVNEDPAKYAKKIGTA